MELEITRVPVGADESIAASTGVLVRRVRTLIAGEVRKTLKRRGAIWDDVTAKGRRGWRVKARRDVITVSNLTAHGVILTRSKTVRGNPNRYAGAVHRLIEREWPHIVQRASDRAAAEASRG